MSTRAQCRRLRKPYKWTAMPLRIPAIYPSPIPYPPTHPSVSPSLHLSSCPSILCLSIYLPPTHKSSLHPSFYLPDLTSLRHHSASFLGYPPRVKKYPEAMCPSDAALPPLPDLGTQEDWTGWIKCVCGCLAEEHLAVWRSTKQTALDGDELRPR